MAYIHAKYCKEFESIMGHPLPDMSGYESNTTVVAPEERVELEQDLTGLDDTSYWSTDSDIISVSFFS